MSTCAVGAPAGDAPDVGRNGGTAVQGAVDHYEVTYNYRGSPRTVQMAAPPPNNKVVVNQRGEPRM